MLKAYVDSKEGIDRAGGFAIQVSNTLLLSFSLRIPDVNMALTGCLFLCLLKQGRGSLLVRCIEGDYNNVVGFPLYAFSAFLHDMIENEELDIVEDDD